jgi:hypothetical protein
MGFCSGSRQTGREYKAGLRGVDGIPLVLLKRLHKFSFCLDFAITHIAIHAQNILEPAEQKFLVTV